MKSLLTVVVAAGAALLLSSCSLLSGLGGSDRPTGEVSQSQQVDAFSLKVGDCLISTDLGDSFSEVPLVPCSQAHDVEIIKIFDMADGAYSQDAIDEAAYQCEAAIAEYVGPDWESTGLDWNRFSPTEGSWGKGDREIDCIAYTLSGELDLTASVKGIA
ncbi:MAG: septum formation family protein [Propionibacteriaceae bacterium]|nr:septum formation family protein [Propionibacteriaceae bacterium]